ncbi:MAG: tetratricopeptide repeat protein [Betaproteobacteria bacterium]|nr:tetratricopeptide repeat protein [Betaproteobacteria bacterium]
MARIFSLLFAAFLALAAAAQPPYPEITTRAAALEALEHADARHRLAGVVYIGRTGLAADGPLLVKRLSDRDPLVRELAEAGVWLVWGRSGDAETDHLLAAGAEEMRAGRYPRAIGIFSEVIKRSPDFAEGWNKRATAYYLAGDLYKSLADCDEVMKRNPQHFGALSGYGQIYVRLEEHEKAIDYFRRALAANPNLTDLETVIRSLEELVRERRRRSI